MTSHSSNQSLSSLAATGMVWATIGTIASKLASLGAQLVLGWVLSSEDFALYAIAISWSTIILALRNAGTQRFLIQKGSGGYDGFASICFKIALLFNGVGFVLLALAAPALSHLYESTSLNTIIWIIALSLPLNTASLIFQAKLSSDMSFGKLTQINIWSAILRHGSMAAFALTGFGPLSFVLPLILIAVFETLAGWHMVGAWPPKQRLTWPAMRDVLRDSRWVMLTSLASILVMNGDYLAISLLQSKETLGIYYFGFQLSFSLAALFTNGVEAVMMPAFSRLHHDQERQKLAFFKAVRVLMLGATLACFALVLAATPLIHGLWGGKWDRAIPVVQLLALSLPVKLVVPLCRSLIEGRGEWKFVSRLLLTDGIGTLIAGGLGAWLDGLMTIAAVVSGYNLVLGLIFCGVVTKRIGGRLRDMVIPMMATFALGLISLLA
ncbi:MAG: oligosaccharide flippase family protein, partial [Nitrospira sp.]|nr:oligosaccharide flippase family protein [Nitrospira sp.]